MKAEITKIRLQLKDRSVELTIAEARDVQRELNRLFEFEKIALEKFKEQWEKDHPKTTPFAWPVYYSPIIIERESLPYWPRPWETCGGGTSGVITAAGNTPGTTLCIAVR